MNYTSIEQSKKLVELGLDPSTADMHYNKQMPSTPICQGSFLFPTMEIPCWSAGRLIEVWQRKSLSILNELRTIIALTLLKKWNG